MSADFELSRFDATNAKEIVRWLEQEQFGGCAVISQSTLKAWLNSQAYAYQLCATDRLSRNILGIVCCNRPRQNYVYIQLLLVDQNHRKKGVGAALWNRVKEHFAADTNFGIDTVDPMTADFRDKFGFRISGPCHHYRLEVPKANIIHAIQDWLSERLLTSWLGMRFERIDDFSLAETNSHPTETAIGYLKRLQERKTSEDKYMGEGFWKNLLRIPGVNSCVARATSGAVVGIGVVYPCGRGSSRDFIGQLYADDDVIAFLLVRELLNCNNNLLLHPTVVLTVPGIHGEVLRLLNSISGSKLTAKINRSYTIQPVLTEKELAHTYCLAGNE